MVSEAMSQQQYLAAREALDEIATSITATPQQTQAGQEGRDKLDLEFLNQVISNVQERTAQFQRFIDEMNAVIDEIGRDSPLSGVQKLKGIVETAASVIRTAEGGAGGRP